MKTTILKHKGKFFVFLLAALIVISSVRSQNAKTAKTVELKNANGDSVGTATLSASGKGIAIKLAEKARVAPEKLMELIHAREGTNFAPSGVLRLQLNDEEKDQILAVAQRVLLQVRSDS